MWYTLTLLAHATNPQTHGRLTPRLLFSHLLGPLTSWLGNLVGALFAAYVLSIATATLTAEPYASGISEMVASELLEPGWWVIFARAVGCGWSVTLAMYLGEVCHAYIQSSSFSIASWQRWQAGSFVSCFAGQ